MAIEKWRLHTYPDKLPARFTRILESKHQLWPRKQQGLISLGVDYSREARQHCFASWAPWLEGAGSRRFCDRYSLREASRWQTLDIKDPYQGYVPRYDTSGITLNKRVAR